MTRARAARAAASVVLLAACASTAAPGSGGAGASGAGDDGPEAAPDSEPAASNAPPPPPPAFDPAALPTLPDGTPWHAVVERDIAPARVLYALSDVHGAYDRLAALLAAAQITSGVPSAPSSIAWIAGESILVVTGDLFDKGAQGIEVIDALAALQASAAAAGGEVIVLSGNHEAEFFVDPHNSKATDKDGFDVELAARGIDPDAVASGADPHGKWLRLAPLGARVNGWFFSHAGDTHAQTVAALDLQLRAAVALHPTYDDPALVGDDSILEARGWYAPKGTAETNAAALGVAHVVFGHDPNAIGKRGAIATALSGLLLRIDCGMSPDVDDSQGCVLRVRHDGPGLGEEIAEQLDASGAATELFRTP